MSELRLLTRLCLLVWVQQAPARVPEEKLPAYVEHRLLLWIPELPALTCWDGWAA